MSETRRRARALIWREPLLHFVLIGAALFLLYRVLNGSETGPSEIVVTQPRVAALQEGFARTWLRPPSAEELDGLIEDYIREEIFYREAIAAGLDRDDSVVRRRLRQKMEFIAEDLSDLEEPTEAQLAKYLESHREQFVEPPRTSFEHIYFNPERRGDTTLRDLQRELEALRAGRASHTPGTLGDPSLLPGSMNDASPQDVASVFGEDFAKQLDEARAAQWTGPIPSSYGLHLVRVSVRSTGALPDLGEVRPLVVREWQYDQARRRGDALYQSLRDKYDVRVERTTP